MLLPVGMAAAYLARGETRFREEVAAGIWPGPAIDGFWHRPALDARIAACAAAAAGNAGIDPVDGTSDDAADHRTRSRFSEALSRDQARA